MATSKFQDARAALAALIVARLVTDGVTGVDVTEYRPTGNATREDKVWIDRITVDQEVVAMGGTSRVMGETLTFNLQVVAPRAGADLDDMKLAEQRAELIFASVENAIRNSPTISATLMHGDIESFESVPTYDELGAVCVIEAVVTAQSNI